MMLKNFISLFLGIFTLVAILLPANVSAQNSVNKLCGGANLTFKDDAQDCSKNAAGESADSVGRIEKLIKDIINVVSIIVGVIAVIMVIYGGFRFVTSAGNPESTKTARNAILYAIIGLIIVAFAQFIVKFVLAKAVGVTEDTPPAS